MRILITGGAGFIGSNVAAYFLERGFQVTVLDNLSTGHRQNIPRSDRLTFIEGDIRNQALVDEHAKECGAVIHLAAAVGNIRSIELPKEDSEINVIGTLTVLEAARKAGVKKFVYSSSAAIFGEPQQLPIDESHPLAPDSPYGVSKLAGELHALAYGKLYNIDAVCLRYFNVYGPNQRYDAYGNVMPIFATCKLNQKALTIYGDGEQTRDFVHVTDVAQANFLAATTPQVAGTYNIGAGNTITINQLAALMNDLPGQVPVSILYKPSRPGEVKHSLANIQKAKTRLHYSPTQNITTGLQGYWQWFQNQ